MAERGDDSYGNIGDLRLEAFRVYLQIDWAATGMAPEHRWQDLCELVEAILLSLADEWRAAYQDYQADEAIQLTAWLHIAGRRYTRYIDVAGRLGSDHWMPIVALAESALAASRHDLAVDVFRATNRPGMHQCHLRQRCLKMTDVRLDEPERHLRGVSEESTR